MPKLLLSLVRIDKLFDDIDMLKKLEDIVKVVFNTSGELIRLNAFVM